MLKKKKYIAINAAYLITSQSNKGEFGDAYSCKGVNKSYGTVCFDGKLVPDLDGLCLHSIFVNLFFMHPFSFSFLFN